MNFQVAFYVLLGLAVIFVAYHFNKVRDLKEKNAGLVSEISVLNTLSRESFDNFMRVSMQLCDYQSFLRVIGRSVLVPLAVDIARAFSNVKHPIIQGKTLAFWVAAFTLIESDSFSKSVMATCVTSTMEKYLKPSGLTLHNLEFFTHSTSGVEDSLKTATGVVRWRGLRNQCSSHVVATLNNLTPLTDYEIKD